MIFRGQKKDKERGANLVEFAILMPLLVLLILGIVELGFKFSQFNELRHGVREGARYAAVTRPDLNGSGVDNSDIVKAVCDAINLPNTTLSIALANESGGSGNRLDYASVEVTATVPSLTSVPIISGFIPTSLTNKAVFRLEQDFAAGVSTFGGQACP